MITLKLPLPPTVNHYQRNARNGHRYTTKDANAWKQEAGWAINRQLGRHEPLKGDICVSMQMQRRGDCDNRIKPVLDLLQDHRIFENDRQVARLIVSFADIEGCEVQITQAQRP